MHCFFTQKTANFAPFKKRNWQQNQILLQNTDQSETVLLNALPHTNNSYALRQQQTLGNGLVKALSQLRKLSMQYNYATKDRKTSASNCRKMKCTSCMTPAKSKYLKCLLDWSKTRTHCLQLPVFQSPCTNCPPLLVSSHPAATIINSSKRLCMCIPVNL